MSGNDDRQKIWLDLTQQELDAAYDQSIYAPNREQILNRYRLNSETTRQRLGAPRVLRYGSGAKETLEVFSPAQAHAPVVIFVHGGAWRSGSAGQYAFLADFFTDAGFHLVLPNFDWVQDCAGDLLPIADQVRRAIVFTCRQAEQFSANPEQLLLAGHSSGAHMAAVALTTDWPGYAAMPANLIKGALLCSGMYDLLPVSLSARSQYVNFSLPCLEQLSPMRHIGAFQMPLLVTYGDLETPEFQRQSQDFFTAIADKHPANRLIVAREYNHFEILETLANPFGRLGAAALRLACDALQ